MICSIVAPETHAQESKPKVPALSTELEKGDACNWESREHATLARKKD
jgi:hypothetical protein